MNDLSNNIRNFIIFTYVLFYIVYEYISISIIGSYSFNSLHDYLLLFVLNMFFMLISYYLITYSRKKLVFYLILALFLFSISHNFFYYFNISELKIYLSYCLLFVLVLKIFFMVAVVVNFKRLVEINS